MSMLIRDLETATGLERATIRFYEKEGLITPIRQENGYRMYSEGDRDTLLKVKLLRQLGMSLEKIKGLQQGSEDFSTALNEQITALEKQVKDATRAKEVCAEIRDAGASYGTLDAAHYLRELTKVTQSRPAWTPQPVPEFRRATPVHPWKRYFARYIDYSILETVIYFLLVAVFRIRPINALIYQIVGFAWFTHLLWMPIEGVLLHYFGTTPGKWIMGIRVESANGGHLTISDAMKRTWNVFRYGYGFTIPIYNIWRLYKSYKDYNDYCYVQWDRDFDSEVQFNYYYETRKKVVIASLAVLFVFLFGFSLNDSIRARHRGEDLTVAQFAKNYNDYVDTVYDDTQADPMLYMREDGKWMYKNEGQHDPNSAVILIGSKAVGGYADFVYETENGYIRSITYKQSWEDILMLSPVTNRMVFAFASVANAQDWMSLPRYYEFAKELEKAVRTEDGSFVYENLELRWTTESENCRFSGNVFYATDDSPSAVHQRIEIIIHDIP